MKKFFSGIMSKISNIPFGAVLIVLAMSVVPLVMRYYVFHSKLNQFSWYGSNDQSVDVFNYYKSVALRLIAVFMIITLIVTVTIGKKLTWNKVLVPLCVYAGFVVLSTVCSEYNYFCTNGIESHFETVYVLLSYCLLTLFSFWFVESEKILKFVMYGWFIGIAAMGIIGVLQVTSHDIFRTALGEWLIVPEKFREAVELSFRFELDRVYLTVYNPNYVGFYGALVIPVMIAFFVYSKNIFIKSVSVVLEAVIFLCVMGSGARNGMIAIFVALVCMLVLFRKTLIKNWWKFLVCYGIVAVIFVGYDLIKGGAVSERLESGLTVNTDSSINDDIKDNIANGEVVQGGHLKLLEEIVTGDDKVTIKYNGNELICRMAANATGNINIYLNDGNGADIKCDAVEGEVNKYTINDERFPFFVTVGYIGDTYGFAIDIGGRRWSFSNMLEDGSYYFYAPHGKFTKIDKAESAIFTNYSSLFSNRGYIWARSIPLLKDKIFVGSGPDTFSIVFPQEDYVKGFYNMIVSKPHNLYLQIGVQTGVVSLIAFLVFNAMFLIQGIMIYWKKKPESLYEYVGMAIMIAVIGYLISGIINDSTITVAPIYWCLMGIGLAVNREVKKGRSN